MMISHFGKTMIIGVSIVAGIHTSKAQQNIGSQMRIDWKASPSYNGSDNLELKIVLHNISNKPVDLQPWNLWFNSMFPIIDKKTQAYQLTNERGNLFKFQFLNQVINPSDSLELVYQTQYPISNISTAPAGFYFQDKTDITKYAAINDVVYTAIPLSIKDQQAFNIKLFDKNDQLNKASAYPIVFPTPRSIQVGKGIYTIKRGLTYHIDKGFEKQEFLLSELASTLGISPQNSTNSSADVRIVSKPTLGEEAYDIKIDNHGIQIAASSGKGIFYGIQSLKSILATQKLMNTKGNTFPYVDIKDEPRFPYRGFMLDIARNFRDKETILRYLDAMATYKLNVFHFHLIDDEGWRVEISALPELVEVGAKRSPSFANGHSIRPAYGSGATQTAGYYLTKADFIEILKYANDRFITVVPEIETPGHARAAIKAMETRYHRLKALGKDKEAEEYLLHDIDDASVYNSAQNFNDNVMNPALPSVYTFISTVLEEFKHMYAEAGVKLEKVSLGGDEVPQGAWEKSPKIQQLMREKGFTSVHQVWPYYIERINEICASKSLQLAGWEEIGMVNKGKGMVVNKDFPNKGNLQLDVWNNVIAGGQEDLAYRLANAGFPTVFISASNMYFDMKWNTNFTEPGLKWATYADLYHSFSFLPTDFFANIDTYYSGQSLGKEGFKDRIRLTAEGQKNILGIKGGVFAETVHTDDKLDYMVFPRFFALAERAWSPKRDYEREDSFVSSTFNADYAQFLNRVGLVELPRIADRFAFRLPGVGLKESNGVLYANLEYPNFDVYYTLDGSVPSLKSLKYDSKKGVKFDPNKKYVFGAINAQGRVGQLSYFN